MKFGKFLVLSSLLKPRTKNKEQRTIICLIIIGFLTGCAPKVARTRIDDGVRSPERNKIKIEKIYVERMEGGDEVVIKSSGDSKPISYTAFKLTEPLRLIIDIPDVDPEMYREPIEIEDGLIKRINTDLYDEKSGAIGRIEIEMNKGVEYDLESVGDALTVRFNKEKDLQGVEAVHASAHVLPLLNVYEEGKKGVSTLNLGKVKDGDLQGGKPSPVKVVVVPDAIEEMPVRKEYAGEEKAGRLLAVNVRQGEDGYMEALLIGDGIIGDYNSFGMDDPERVVIDLWGIESALEEDVLFSEDPYVEMIRIGSHPDKTRVVFDMKVPAVSYSVDNRKDGLLVALRGEARDDVEVDGDRTVKEGPVTMVQEDLSQAQVAEARTTRIEGVDFEDMETSSKVVVTASDKVEYDLSKSFDGKTVALILKGVFLPDHLHRTLDVSELDGPVALVSSYRSGVGSDRVMLVMRLNKENTYEITRKGNILAIEFPKERIKEIAEAVEQVSPVEEVKLPSEPEKIAAIVKEPSPVVGEIAEVEVVKEAVKLSAAEVTAVEEKAKLPAEPEKVVVVSEIPEPVKAEVVEVEAVKETVEPSVAKVVDKEVEVKLPLEPEKIAVVAKVSKPVVRKEKEKPDKVVIPARRKILKRRIKKHRKPKKVVAPEVVIPEMVAIGKGYTGKRISLDFKDADIKNILRLIAEVSRLNIVAGANVKGKVTLRLKDIPWDQALEIILKTNDLGMIREGNVLRIAPLQKIAKEREQVLADKKAEEKLEDLIVKLIPVNYAKAGDLQTKVKTLLSERGTVGVDNRTNILIVKDVKGGVEEAEMLVKNLDSPTPQVLIEARIVEASTTFARDIGVEWGVDTAAIANNAQMDLFGNLTTSGLTPPSGQGGTDNFAVSLPASGSAGPLGAMGFTFGKLGGSSLTLDLRLSAGEVGGLSKIVSRPRIVTLDNKKAKISQGKTIPYQTVSDGSVQTQFFDATLDLTVTPHITPDGSVMLEIKASKNSKGEDTAAGPVILKKEASTEILLKDGETTVIGGIVESTESDSGSGVPLFKNIPVLGWLFKRQSVSNDRTELLIFITPTILKGEGR